MITKNNLKDLLETLGFTEEGSIFQKSDGEVNLKVDFGKQRLIYPEGLKVNRQDTCNFSHPENFVVFECVHRLMEKGCTAIGNLDHYLKQDCDIIPI